MKVQKSRILQIVLFLCIITLCFFLINCDLFKGDEDDYYYDTHYEPFPIGNFDGHSDNNGLISTAIQMSDNNYDGFVFAFMVVNQYDEMVASSFIQIAGNYAEDFARHPGDPATSPEYEFQSGVYNIYAFVDMNRDFFENPESEPDLYDDYVGAKFGISVDGDIYEIFDFDSEMFLYVP